MTATDPKSVTGDAGNTNIRNQNEQDIMNAFMASIQTTTAPGGEDSQTYVNPQFREGM